jgi:hypothetical protein
MLEHRAPLHAESLLAFLAARAVPGVEEVAGGAYRRAERWRPFRSYALAHLWSVA